MVEHDKMVGVLLKTLEDLGLADNTIVMYSTDNGAETVSWPDGGITPFNGEKGTTWEGGHRVPLMVRWPGKIKSGTIVNDIVAHNDWMPTFAAAAGEPSVKEKLLQGYQANGRSFKVHLDGYNMLPFLTGQVAQAPREEYLYFGQGGELNAVRWNDWKVDFANVSGNIATGSRTVTNWPLITNLRADPYEKMHELGTMGYLRFYADQLWLFVPVQLKVKEFFEGFLQYPYQSGSSLSVAGINYQALKQVELLRQLQEKGAIAPPRN